MTLSAIVCIAAAACSTDAIPTLPSGPEQNQLVASISIEPSDAVLQPDDQGALQAQVRGARGQVVNGRQITWSTSDPSIVDIDASGNVLAMNEGTATITARHKGVSGTATVDVRGEVVEILFDEIPDLAEGEVRGATANFRYSNGAVREARRVDWRSEDRHVVRIDADGELVGVGEGTVDIYATARGRSAVQQVRVSGNNVAEIAVRAPGSDIEVGERVELWAQVLSASGERLYKKLQWTSQDPSVATVDEHAGVTGVSPGSTTITGRFGAVSGSTNVTIVSPASEESGGSGDSGDGSGSGGSGGSGSQAAPSDVTDLQVTETTYRVAYLSFSRADDGTGADALYEVRYDEASDFDWQTAQVASKGDCDSISPGTPGETVECHIEGLLSATSYRFQLVPYRVHDGQTVYGELSNTADARTEDPAVLVDVVPSAFSIDVGETKQVTASVTDAYGNPLSHQVVWGSSSSTVASVSSTGMVSGNAAGSATIRATAASTSGSSSATIMEPASADDGTGGSSGGTSSTPSAGWNPQGSLACDEDFTRYSDFDDWRARALCGWNIDNVEGWGPNNTQISSRGLMYRFRDNPSNPCRDATVGQATTRIPEADEIWMEFTVEWGAGIDFTNPACPGKGGYKFVLPWTNVTSVSCGDRRYNWIVWNHAGYEATVPGFSQCDDVPVNPGGTAVPGDASTKTYPPKTARSDLAGAPIPGATQTYRVHFQNAGGGVFHVYAEVDGILTHDYVTNSITDALKIDRIMLGSNRNSYAAQDQYMWWKSFKVWAR